MSKAQTLEIRDFAFGGEALGNLADGRVCFVRGAAPGETVEVELTENHRNYCRGKLLQVIGGNSARITPECPSFPDCPGCAYLHVPYEVELAAKERQLDSFINRRREVPVKLPPIYPSPTRFAWRNRIRLHADGSGRLGYRESGELFPIDRCLLMKEEINAKLREATPPPGYVGTWGADFDAKVGAVVLGDDNNARYTGELGEFGTFVYPAGGFFQTNSAVAAELARRVVDLVVRSEAHFMLELYCGVGIFSLICAEKMAQLETLGVESFGAAVRCAQTNAEARHLPERCRFFTSDSAGAMRFLRRKRPQLILVDPPRGGLSSSVIREILQLHPQNLIYISCAADTLCRDLRQLEKGYELKSCAALDMFPGTAHFESLSLLVKKP